ncbi:hypothetical protein D3C80_953590 [compost metagenome]
MKAKLAVNERTVKLSTRPCACQPGNVRRDRAKAGELPTGNQHARCPVLRVNRPCRFQPLQTAFQAAFHPRTGKGLPRKIQPLVLRFHLLVKHGPFGPPLLKARQPPVWLPGQHLLVAFDHHLQLAFKHYRGADEPGQFRLDQQTHPAHVEGLAVTVGVGQRPPQAVRYIGLDANRCGSDGKAGFGFRVDRSLALGRVELGAGAHIGNEAHELGAT